jgi:hypothetical protein
MCGEEGGYTEARTQTRPKVFKGAWEIISSRSRASIAPTHLPVPNKPTASSYPRTINPIHAPTHKRALGPQQERNHIGALLRRPLSPERTRIIKRRIRRPPHEIPVLPHQRRINGPRRNRIDAHFPDAVLLRRRAREADDAVFARVVGSVIGEPWELKKKQVSARKQKKKASE